VDAVRLVDFVLGPRATRGQAQKLAIITGAGVSTESGIPAYRGTMGSYSLGHKPMQHNEFVRDPLVCKIITITL
jgi:NAD-dependent SIR2 family protein deacetylase